MQAPGQAAAGYSDLKYMIWNHGWMCLRNPDLGNPANFHHSSSGPSFITYSITSPPCNGTYNQEPERGWISLGHWEEPVFREKLRCDLVSLPLFLCLCPFSFNQLYNLTRTMRSAKHSSLEILEFTVLVLLGHSSCIICCLAWSLALLSQ